MKFKLKKLIGDNYIKIESFFVSYWETIFPNYNKLRKKAGIKDEITEKIEREMKRISGKYIIYRILLLLLVFVMINAIMKVLSMDKFNPFEVFHANFHVWSLIMGTIGTFFLAKGFIRNSNQIALESASCLGYNPHLAKALIYSRYDTLVGLLFIIVSLCLQLLAFTFSIGV